MSFISTLVISAMFLVALLLLVAVINQGPPEDE
jgi:hypothetical protein